jgi:hypothetical protein
MSIHKTQFVALSSDPKFESHYSLWVLLSKMWNLRNAPHAQGLKIRAAPRRKWLAYLWGLFQANDFMFSIQHILTVSKSPFILASPCTHLQQNVNTSKIQYLIVPASWYWSTTREPTVTMHCIHPESQRVGCRTHSLAKSKGKNVI